MNDLVTTEWYEQLCEDCRDIIVEHEFTSRWALVEGYHRLGERIVTDTEFQKFAKYNLASLQHLAKNLKVGERTIYYAMQFYEKYPDLNLLPAGKNTSWNQVITKYLPQRTEEVKTKRSYADLIAMLKAIKQLLQHELADAHQIATSGKKHELNYDDKEDFIRYLQDQVDKITEGLEFKE